MHRMCGFQARLSYLQFYYSHESSHCLYKDFFEICILVSRNDLTTVGALGDLSIFCYPNSYLRQFWKIEVPFSVIDEGCNSKRPKLDFGITDLKFTGAQISLLHFGP